MTQPIHKIIIVRERSNRWVIQWWKEGICTAAHRVNASEALIMLDASLKQMEPMLNAKAQRP